MTRTGARSRTTLLLCDARTGARIATLAMCDDFQWCGATILSDGTVAVGEAGESGARLRLLSEAGELQREFQLGPGRGVRMGGQATPSTLVVSTRVTDSAPPGSRDRTTLVVDLRTGVVTPLGKGYFPLALMWWLGPVAMPAPGSVATRAFFDPAGRFVVLDPATKTFRAVLSARWYTD